MAQVMTPDTHNPTEVLAGPVERVTFHSPESGFCVLRVKARGHRDLITVVGHAAMISAGEWITASGVWLNDRTHCQRRRKIRPRGGVKPGQVAVAGAMARALTNSWRVPWRIGLFGPRRAI